ncbi:MAG TPA: hypothetical protein DEB06_03885, partial [Phycisphaerales bacterium]|nr:hypothetical protein [Phycisphaerales bacterium]
GGGTGGGADSPGDYSLDFDLVEGTNIEQALRFARAIVPPDAAARLVLVSDGNETAGDALAAARELAAQRSTGARTAGPALPVDVLPLAYSVRNEVMVEAIDAPPQAQSESTVPVRIVLNATDAATGILELLYEGEPIDASPGVPGNALALELPPGRTIVQLDLPLAKAPIHRLQGIFTPDDPRADLLPFNNRAETLTITPGKGSVLIIDGVGQARPASEGLILGRALERAGIQVKTVPTRDAPTDLVALEAHDLVILQNVPAEELPRSTHELLAQFVTDLGGGLVMVGGPDSFGAGAWKGTAIEPLLPVRLDLPEQLIVPSAAVVFVLDNSGSMSQRVGGLMRSQQEVANEGAALAVETLDKTDVLAVLAFNSDTDVVVPMGRNSNPVRTADRVRSIASGGGTNLYPALAKAGNMLRQGDAAKANVRHIIVLSDGQSQGDPQDGLETAARLQGEGITVTTIAVGDGADSATLAQIAAEGGGQFYEVHDPTILPRIFIKEIRVVRKPLIRETEFRPVDLRSSSPLLAGVGRPFPPLLGLVLTQPREDPKINYALATPEGEPLLAHWFVGRGQVGAFTSDASRWASRWLDWPGYAQMWTQIARTIARPAVDKAAEFTAQIVGDDLVVRLDASDDEGNPIDLLSVPGSVFTPDGRRVPVQLAQIGPGAYEARVPAPARGNYVVALFPRSGTRDMPRVVGAATRHSGSEFRSLQSNIGVLRAIADATGGRLLDFGAPQSADLFNRDGTRPTRAASPLWRVLLIWSIAVLLLDVATRRIAWDRLLTRELAEEFRAQAAGAARARGERAAATVAALKKRAESPTIQPPGSITDQPRRPAPGSRMPQPETRNPK